MLRQAAIISACALILSGCNDQANGGGAGSRSQIKVVGSSTVYPFTTLVAEQFVNKTPGTATPVIESTGTGAGMKLFCAGVGAQHPDIEDASRRMTAGEFRTCSDNGVDRIMEIQIGIDGIAFAESNNGPKLQLSPVDIYLALAANPRGAKNSTKTWKDVNPGLPAIPIQVYGPPSTSGTRDALAELILARGCAAIYPDSLKLKDKNPDAYAAACTRIRDDGPYVDAGENDNLIVQKMASNPNAIGVFGYSYLEENKATINGIPISGVEPTYETIARGSYPGARPLYLYVKKAHLTAIPGLQKFLAEYAASWGPDGPLVKRGLIAAPQAIREASAKIIENGTTLDGSALK
ncbi:MAG: phosphate ABC transporter substrate-binding protein [Sphingomonas sp. 28-66-16]|nr:MAG: phosphate ABC transporter substrate-binding protein [Sphingomonas sp. 28-66-16]